jgi:transposase, IS5 family
VSRAAAQQISFADWELMRQGGHLEPLLRTISNFLDNQKEMIERVRRDLVRGLKKPDSGRRGLTPQQILRSLVLMRVKNWDYRELRERIADGLMLRQFTDFYCEPVPMHDAFQRGFVRLTSATLKAINDLVVQAAVDLGLEDGTKLRVDTPRWCRPTFITRPTTRCCGMWYASSRAWSAVSPKRWNCVVSRVFVIARVRHGVGCTRSNA